MTSSSPENLFSYGTLQREEVQLATFNRPLEGFADTLQGYAVDLIPIRDHAVIKSIGDSHYRNIVFTGQESDQVAGMVFKVSPAELELADEYERDAEYTRITVQLKSGTISWVYLKSED